MALADDTKVRLQAAVEFVNRIEPLASASSDLGLEDARARCATSGSRSREDADLAAARLLRRRLRELLTSDRDGAVAIVNDLLERAGATPQLARRATTGWQLRLIHPKGQLADRIAAETALAMIEVIQADEMSRLGVCAREDCQNILLDLSRNRSRKYCGISCGTRAAAAAYRDRQTRASAGSTIRS